MALIKLNFTHLIIVILLGVVAFQYFWPKPEAPVDDSKYIEIGSKRYKIMFERSEVKYIPVSTKTVSYKPASPISVSGPGKIVYADKPIDTAAVVKAYHTLNYYEDLQPIDSIGFVNIMDTVYGNKIISRRLQFDYELPVITNTIVTETPPVNKVFFGGGLGFNSQDFISNAHVGIMVKSKRDKLYGINIGAVNQDNNLAPYIGGSIYWKIKLRRNK